ncbi:hypothetical protein TWF788_008906 [Orbilia oligospora]|uniref:F-box domain-containing protein n=1 Tax=Orbilia oligospora TaxID=2813651 RepID=A0A6G1M8X6_ORBOL|nr:hypothetical protein TWF788_008906 [Orbilia oligospora]KAF3230839.1 hypothetical protein TWF191_008680 [Orbilia oligospora]KAF3250252.1 hypothetical protein TWF192_005273 [Orbilia oligospora]
MPASSCSPLFSIPEIIEQVLQHVPPLELLGSCRAVCLVWNRVISTSWLLKYYSITGLYPQQQLSAISLLQLTPAARGILSLFWQKLHDLLAKAGRKDPELASILYKLYTSFQHPLRTIVLFQPPPGQQQNLESYKTTSPPALRCHDRDAEGRRRLVFESLFAQNNGYEDLEEGNYPLQNIVYTLCERAHHLEPQTFLRISYNGDFYTPYGDRTYFKPRSVRVKVHIPRVTNEPVEDQSVISSDIHSRDMRWGRLIGEPLQPWERVVSVEFSREEPFTVSAKQAEY